MKRTNGTHWRDWARGMEQRTRRGVWDKGIKRTNGTKGTKETKGMGTTKRRKGTNRMNMAKGVR